MRTSGFPRYGSVWCRRSSLPRLGADALPTGVAVLPHRETFGAIAAREAGLVTEVTDAATFDEVVATFCGRFLEASPTAVSATKGLIRGSRIPLTRSEVLDVLMTLFEVARAAAESDDSCEGRAAFLAKRKPEWSGVVNI